MFTRVIVGDNERVLIARNKRFAKILGPGEYQVFGFGITQERFNVRDLVFASEWADFIVKERQDVAAECFTVIETSDSQVAVIAVERKVARVTAPGRRVLAHSSRAQRPPEWRAVRTAALSTSRSI